MFSARSNNKSFENAFLARGKLIMGEDGTPS